MSEEFHCRLHHRTFYGAYGCLECNLARQARHATRKPKPIPEETRRDDYHEVLI